MPLGLTNANANDNDNANKRTIEEFNENQDHTNTIYFFEKLRKKITSTYFFMYTIITTLINVCGIYLVWIILHYISCHLYVYFCVPNTIIGFLMSPFMTATPHCLGLRWIIYNAANMINNMWLILGTWVCSTLLIIKNN